jgi:hypothetical protein
MIPVGNHNYAICYFIIPSGLHESEEKPRSNTVTFQEGRSRGDAVTEYK